MKSLYYCFSSYCLFFLFLTTLNGQREPAFHIGVVQPILAINDGNVQYFYQNDFYAIGFPMGINFKLAGNVKFDFEFVPFVKPYINSDKAYQVHLLFHPGVLIPLAGGVTFGLRLAFESGLGQFGITPLINKGFNIGNNTKFFLELVAPGRFGPDKGSGYTQIFGLHTGIGF